MSRATALQRVADNAVQKARRDVETAQTVYRVKVLPEQLERARLRVAHLENEARRLGMVDLLA